MLQFIQIVQIVIKKLKKKMQLSTDTMVTAADSLVSSRDLWRTREVDLFERSNTCNFRSELTFPIRHSVLPSKPKLGDGNKFT